MLHLDGGLTIDMLKDSGWTDEMLLECEDAGYSIKTVRVKEPCECSCCAAGMRWFQCLSPKAPIATYIARADRGLVLDVDLNQIEAENPGKILVY